MTEPDGWDGQEWGWTPQDFRTARKILRRVELGQDPFANWLVEIRVARLAIALSLVRFFVRLRAVTSA